MSKQQAVEHYTRQAALADLEAMLDEAELLVLTGWTFEAAEVVSRARQSAAELGLI